MGLAALLWAAPLDAQHAVALQGRLLDAETGRAVEGAEVVVPGLDLATFTDALGRFRLDGLLPGPIQLRVSHLAYGVHTESAQLPEDSVFAVELRLTPQALVLEAIEVTAQRRPRTESTRSNVIDREQIESVVGRARHIGDLLRSFVPGAVISEARGGFLCVEFRAARASRTSGCNYPLIVVDGLPVYEAPRFLRDLTLEELERVEYVPASEGSARYGMGATHGVLVIETRRSGVVTDPGRMEASRYPNYSWSVEPGGHPTARAWAGATLGALGGLAAGLAAIGCLPGPDVPDGGCVESAGAGTGLAALALPWLGSSLGAHWLGRTEVSRGRWLPSLAMTALPAALSYAVYVDGERSGFRSERLLGAALLAVGTPLVSTLADHLYRGRH